MSQETWSHFHQIRASAGSGKTYKLTTNFLLLLAGAGDPEGTQGCRIGATQVLWPEIMAITFTNQAAGEMRERIVSRIKDMALSPDLESMKKVVPEELWQAGWTPSLAKQHMESILHHLSLLNVRTIDSLLHLIVRLSALDLNLSPDFEPIFDFQEAMSPFLDDLLEKTRAGADQDQEITALLDKACREIVYQRTQSGFLAGKKVRERILDVFFKLEENLSQQIADKEKIDSLIQNMFDEMDTKIEKLQSLCPKQVKKNMTTALANMHEFTVQLKNTGLCGEMPHSEYFQKKSFSECLNKHATADAEAEAAYQEFKQAFLRAKAQEKILKNAYKLLPYLDLAQEMHKMLPDFLQKADKIPADFVATKAGQVLSEENGVSNAICRIGSRLLHILIDEFQDTSREQWQAIHPLVLEALSKYGSFTWVGDIKQAIYGWRKGDSALFDEILCDHELQNVAKMPQKEILPYNWRSDESIVTLNNEFFSQLGNQDIAKEVLNAILPAKFPQTEEVKQNILNKHVELLSNAFIDASQELPKKGKPQGYVRIQTIVAEQDDLDEKVHTELLSILRKVKQRRKWEDIAILVRKNERASQVAEWLLAEEIPVVTENSFLLIKHPLITQLVAFLRFLNNATDDSAFLALLSGHLFQTIFHFSEEQLQEWLTETALEKEIARKKVEEKSKDQTSSSQKTKSVFTPLYASFRKDFPEIWKKWLQPFHDDAGLLTPYDAVCEFLDHLNVKAHFPKDLVFIQRFLEILHLAEERGFGSFSTFLAQWEKEGQSEKAPMPESLDAVRVITIHKAKGLQFPVVIIPWHDFDVKSQNLSKEIISTTLKNLSFLTFQNNEMEEYYHSLLNQVRETFHIVYVAWTRAENELYVLLPTKQTAKQNTFTALLKILLSHIEITENLYERGENPNSEESLDESSESKPSEQMKDVQKEIKNNQIKSKSISKEKKESLKISDIESQESYFEAMSASSELKKTSDSDIELKKWHPMQWLPQLRINRSPLSDITLEGKRRGTFVHHCLSCLQIPDSIPTQELAQNLAKQTVEQGVRSFPLPIQADETTRQNIVDILAWYIAQPETAHWIHHGRPEQQIVNEEGKLFRSDLLVEDESGITVVEYKTGQQYDEHKQQLHNYMQMLDAMHIAQQNVKGALVYLDLQSIVYC